MSVTFLSAARQRTLASKSRGFISVDDLEAEAEAPRLDLLPDDVIKQILLSTLGAGASRFACCSHSCLATTQSNLLWCELCNQHWPYLAKVKVVGWAAPIAFRGPIIPKHLYSDASSGRDIYRARYLATQAALRVDLVSLYDESIAVATAVASTRRPCELRRLSQLLDQIDGAGHCDMGQTALASEGRAWLWLLASLLLRPAGVEALCIFAKAANDRLDEWYDCCEAGGEAVLRLLTAALRDRSALEAVLTVLRWWVLDLDHLPPGPFASALQGYVSSALAGLRRLTEATTEINANLLGMRAEVRLATDPWGP